MIWILMFLLVVLAWVIYVFHTLSTLSNEAHGAWADIYEHLKRRCELVPQLVELTKDAGVGALAQQLTAASEAGMKAFSPVERSQTEQAIVDGINAILKAVETRPEFKDHEQFRSVRHVLLDIEDHVRDARTLYNAHVLALNTALESPPNSWLAPYMAITPQEYFPSYPPQPAA